MNPLARAHRRSLYATGGVLVLTGLAWALLRYLPAQLGIDDRVAVPANALLMKIHGGAAMVALLLLGALVPRHVPDGWRLARNRASGIALATLAASLAVTGYLLYYAGDERLRSFTSLAHLVAGLVVPGVVIAHAMCRTRDSLQPATPVGSPGKPANSPSPRS